MAERQVREEHMKKQLGRLHKIPHRVKEYVWTAMVFLLILLLMAIPDLIYYYCPKWWRPGVWPVGTFCTFVRQKGFSYTGALRSLKNNFGILVTAISVIITMSVNNLNRSENKFFGFTRSEFVFSKRQSLYRYGRRMILFAPLAMIVAVNLNFSILGYGILMLCYLFIVIAYFLFESSFSRDKDLDCIVRRLYEAVSQNVQDQEDITDYRMMLNLMSLWNEKEKYWEGVNFLFRGLCDQAREDAIERRYILCYCFYETMYLRNNDAECDRAVYALKEYIQRGDRRGWTQEDYLVLWGMLHCLLTEGDRDNILCFIAWYVDFPNRSRRLGRKYSQEDTCEDNSGHNCRIDSQTVRMQTGILLVELELYFSRHTELETKYSSIWNRLFQIWNEGKYILDESNKVFRMKYLEINKAYDLGWGETDKLLQNLCSDYQYNTTKSMTTYYLKYR